MPIGLIRKRHTTTWLAVLVLSLSSSTILWIGWHIWQTQNLNDDSFITLTYTKNLVAGNGFVYNHPPATLGTTTPLFTLLTAFLAWCLPFLTVDEHAILLSLGSWIGVGWVLYATFRHQTISPIAAAIAASVPLLLPHFWLGLIGMEIWLFQCLLVLSIYLALKNQGLYAGLSVAALFLTRGEGALVGVILGLYLWYKHRQLPLAFGIGGSSAVLVWVIYAVSTFGTMIPNTLWAKRVQAQLPTGRNFIERIALDLLPNYLRTFNLLETWLLNPVLILIGLGLLYMIFSQRSLLLFVAWGLAYLIGYTILNPSPYFWYVLHIVFICQVLAGLGLANLGMQLRRLYPQPGSFAIGVVGLTLFAAILYFNIYFLTAQLSPFSGDARGADYRAVAAWLKENTQPDESVAFIEIGYLGYFTDNRIIDLAGLIDPVITPHVLEDGFSWGVHHYQPDYYLYADEFAWAIGDLDPPPPLYKLIYRIERQSQPTPMYIFKRID